MNDEDRNIFTLLENNRSFQILAHINQVAAFLSHKMTADKQDKLFKLLPADGSNSGRKLNFDGQLDCLRLLGNKNRRRPAIFYFLPTKL